MLLASNSIVRQSFFPDEGLRFRHLIDELPIALC